VLEEKNFKRINALDIRTYGKSGLNGGVGEFIGMGLTDRERCHLIRGSAQMSVKLT